MKKLKNLIRTIPDFPKKGILFRDITPILQDGNAFKKVITIFKRETPKDIKKVVAIESRGFIFGASLAYLLGVGFVPIRKSGKLPWKKVKMDYDLEYGTDTIEIHEDAIEKGEKVVLIDDLLATGGTALASVKLIEKCGGIVEKILFLVELTDLNGREKLKNYDVFSLIKF
ncbi:MAG: adenine phosphoribosyltransferase [Candidatus Omnitrophica bacterium]|nr:adenine phosphoribosyltransferase [Candidatus Omnitrophota bacterium]MCM8809081.1 adenine phosphoribosyltransferase [Candidatus Omnitrophota bacterium]MCM8811308.1 adenine phosphoribosyltransferase [Candidatus Omnitrophota bacterium]MCM8833285.1 adenine phosphoribosyltransferase [Candidatus Omnitrophota bacterium]